MCNDIKQDIKESVEGMWEVRFSNLESKMTKILSDLEELSTRITTIDNKIAIDEESTIQRPITEGYIETILNKIGFLKSIIQSKTKGGTLNFFSPSLILTESIEKQILDSQHVSERQLNDLNNIYAREVKK